MGSKTRRTVVDPLAGSILHWIGHRFGQPKGRDNLPGQTGSQVEALTSYCLIWRAHLRFQAGARRIGLAGSTVVTKCSAELNQGVWLTWKPFGGGAYALSRSPKGLPFGWQVLSTEGLCSPGRARWLMVSSNQRRSFATPNRPMNHVRSWRISGC